MLQSDQGTVVISPEKNLELNSCIASSQIPVTTLILFPEITEREVITVGGLWLSETKGSRNVRAILRAPLALSN